MTTNITYKKEIDENGNEIMVEIERFEYDEPLPEESLEDKAYRLMEELKKVLYEINVQNSIKEE